MYLQDHTGYSSDEADRGYDRPGSNPSLQPSSAAPRRAENGGQSRVTGGDAGRLVNQICTPGGLRAQPSREHLSVFVESVGSQDGQTVAELLEDKLVSHGVDVRHGQAKSEIYGAKTAQVKKLQKPW